MIKHHPTQEMLVKHSSGELSFSLSIAVSAHIEMCPECKEKLQMIEASQADQAWQLDNVENADFGDMLQDILATPSEQRQGDSKRDDSKQQVSIEGQSFTLPNAFNSFNKLKWSGLGIVSRARVINDENNERASLLHIKKGGEIPVHQHKGFEVTLLLSGSFSDEYGTYQKGDFILLSGDAKHSPKTDHGCLCYTVQDAPLHFVSGLSKALNPLGKFIY